MTTKQNAIAILRRSTDEQENSLDAQRRKIELEASLCNLHIDPDHYFSETDSGTIPFFERSQTAAAIDAAKQNDIRLIIFAYLDRFSRDTRDGLNAIYALREKGIRCRFCDIPDDSDNPAGEFALTIFLGTATFERGRLLERQRNTIDTRRENGLAIGPPPFGSRRASDDPDSPDYKRLEEDPREQAIISFVAAATAGGDVGSRRMLSMLEQQRRLDPRFHPRSGQDKAWNRSSVQKIMARCATSTS